MNQQTIEQKIYYTLRIAAAMCFIGHGAFGIITKPIWCNYFAVFGIGHDAAYQLMPVLGSVDILLGLSLLFYPTRAVAGWLVVWGLVTASLRPLSGESFGELIERAGNFGAPLALILLSDKASGLTAWFKMIQPPVTVAPIRMQNMQICLRWVAFFLLAGHGMLNLVYKKGLLTQYTSLGFHNANQIALTAGIIELAAAVFILVKPMRSILVVFIVWKMATELFYPHWEIFEWIERGGSYGTLIALWFSLGAGASVIAKAESTPMQPAV